MSRLRALAALVALALLAAPAARAEAAAPAPVVVELFTSQGCLSCPPADRLLATLGRESGGGVVPLSFHVDFWDHLGWRDPFSSAAWSRRQEAYGERFGERLYTPEAVVGGRTGMIGSEEKKVRAAIAEAAGRPAARLALTLAPGDGAARGAVAVDLPPELRGRRLELLVAVWESGLVTAVARGENGGRALAEDYVVRALERAAKLDGRDAASRHDFRLKLAPDWRRENLGVAAFLQDPATLEIVGAAAAPIAPAGAR